MILNTSSLTKRQFLSTLSVGLCASMASPSLVHAQGGAGKHPSLVQIADESMAQRDVSKDFLVGSRAALQEFNAQGGLRGQTIRHQVIPTDGSAAQVAQAWAQAQQDSSCLAVFGSSGNDTALAMSELADQAGAQLAHIAPWLQSSSAESLRHTFPIFASREQQLKHALQSVALQGTPKLWVVYESTAQHTANSSDIRQLAQGLKISLQEMPVQADLTAQARQLSKEHVPMVLFVGGTPELVQLMRGWHVGNSMRYIIALADVNLQTALQMNTNKYAPVIGTQAVPVVTAALPIVRRYRAALGKYFDEPPTALSLAGYLSARYTLNALQNSRSLTRSAVLEGMLQRSSTDLEGFRVEVAGAKMLSAYVTQSMLSAEGRVIG